MPQEALLTSLEAARWAPSSFNAQPWRFIYALLPYIVDLLHMLETEQSALLGAFEETVMTIAKWIVAFVGV